MVVPEPGETELIVRATHVEAPAVDVYEDADGQRSFAVAEDQDADDEFAPDDPVEFADFVDLDAGSGGETQEMAAVDYESRVRRTPRSLSPTASPPVPSARSIAAN